MLPQDCWKNRLMIWLCGRCVWSAKARPLSRAKARANSSPCWSPGKAWRDLPQTLFALLQQGQWAEAVVGSTLPGGALRQLSMSWLLGKSLLVGRGAMKGVVLTPRSLLHRWGKVGYSQGSFRAGMKCGCSDSPGYPARRWSRPSELQKLDTWCQG